MGRQGIGAFHVEGPVSVVSSQRKSHLQCLDGTSTPATGTEMEQKRLPTGRDSAIISV